MEIPDDVAFTIFSKLPLKSLKRFTCVHKSSADILDIPYFMSMFRTNFLSQHQSYHDDTSLLLLQQNTLDGSDYHGSLYLLLGDKLEKTLKSDCLPYEEHRRFLSVSGSGVHGILCLCEASDSKYVLWNPATQELRIIPPSPRESEAYIEPYGFGYDPVTDDFMVIRHIKFYPYEYHSKVEDDNDNDNSDDDDDDDDDEDDRQDEHEDDWQDEPMIPDHLPSRIVQPFWEIYSLRCNSWRRLEAHMPGGRSMGGNIYMNGVCHWLGYSSSDYYCFDTHLISFNFSNDIFYTTLLPLDLALISRHEETTTFTYGFWVNSVCRNHGLNFSLSDLDPCMVLGFLLE